ncbi:penicillin-binding protein activator [Halopseudomonas bauzanensis]|uniref:penicillin-binding protein activator n=1 Tax=Halopseudomonas bauzanensis TaxID=653930 RepID=UPI00255683EB|nr:penicillin-binding protein activator [Halopseudomonas bauzanensis]
MLRMNRLPLAGLLLASLIAGCSSTPRQLSELPATTDTPVEDILRQAERRSGAEAHLLRLHAAQTAFNRNQPDQVRSILAMIPQSDLPLDQQQRFSELQARSELALDQPAAALRALRHPSLQQLDSLTPDAQLEIQLLRAETMAAAGEYLSAAQERIFIHNLLPANAQQDNLAQIWNNLNQAPTDQLREAATAATGDLAGWLELALIVRDHGNLDLQVHAMQQWQDRHATHPAAVTPPEGISRLLELHAERPQHIALLLPFEGGLAAAAEALRDGFLSAQYHAHSEGLAQPRISLYDSGAYPNLLQFYQQAQADGVQWVVGPLDRQQVASLAALPALPLPTLALNYADTTATPPPGLFQFGLAPEDEARSAALQAWQDGHRQMAILANHDDWSQRSARAFVDQWQELGGQLVGHELIDEPARISGQIAGLLQVRESQQPNQEVTSGSEDGGAAQPTPRPDLDALFLAAAPLQARQIKPTLVFQYAGDLPVYAASRAYRLSLNGEPNPDIDGIMIAEIPWLLTRSDPLYQTVVDSWPTAAGPMGRLYAMGVDAQRIFSRLLLMQEQPETRIDGATGTLSLNSNGRILRVLPWGEMVDGQLRPMLEPPLLLQ